MEPVPGDFSWNMSLDLRDTTPSRIRKPGAKTTALKRTSSSPFAGHPRTKFNQRSSTDGVNENRDLHVPLDDTGRVVPLAADSPVRSVPDAIEYAFHTMFDEMPDRAGMNSTRISEVLNFRKNLPPVLSLAHVHSLVGASTRTEREVASLNAAGKLRRIAVVGRGNDISGLGEFLIPEDRLVSIVKQSSVSHTLKGAFEDFSVLVVFDILADNWVQTMSQNPRAKLLPPNTISTLESAELIKNGLLVSPSAPTTSSDKYTSNLGKITTSMQIAANAASGSERAIGDPNAFSALGGRRGTPGLTMDRRALAFSVPNLGSYLRLLTEARSHLTGLLKKSKDQVAPLYLLRERWDGAVDSDNPVSNAKRVRGEFAGILPGKTKKWTHFYGLSFDWALQECLGAGLIELFETQSVGYGVRSL